MHPLLLVFLTKKQGKNGGLGLDKIMKIAYIAWPYRDGTINWLHDNIEDARKVALKYWGLGYAVICPHTNSAYMDGVCSDAVWLNGYLAILHRCDTIVMLPGYEGSTGALAELDLAKDLHLEIIYG